MEKKKVYSEGEKAPGGISIENTLNKNEDELPFGYFNPETEAKLTWVCNYGENGKQIISVFCFDHGGGKPADKDVRILEDLEQAKYMRDELVKNGWKKLVPPKIEFTVTSEHGGQRSFGRKERRHLDREIRRAAKKHAKISSHESSAPDQREDANPHTDSAANPAAERSPSDHSENTSDTSKLSPEDRL